jgi:hypothetical protein
VSLGMPLVINATGAFRRITSVYAGLKEVKSTESSSKSSRKLAQSFCAADRTAWALRQFLRQPTGFLHPRRCR